MFIYPKLNLAPEAPIGLRSTCHTLQLKTFVHFNQDQFKCHSIELLETMQNLEQNLHVMAVLGVERESSSS